MPYLLQTAIRGIIYLPRPRCIYYAISGDIQKDSLKGIANDIKKIKGSPMQVSGIRVFEYTCPDFDGVQLAHFTDDPNPLWRPPKKAEGNPAKFKDRLVFVLHIYDEPATTMTDEEALEHTVEEFNKSLEVLDVAVQMTKKAGDLEPPDNPPEGLCSAELSTLDIRRRKVLELLNQARGGEPDDSGGGNGGQVCSGAHAVLGRGISVQQEIQWLNTGNYSRYFRGKK